MTYRIDVPSLIASGVQRSVTDELSESLRTYVQDHTTDVAELRRRLAAVLQHLPEPALTTEQDEVTIQAELLGAFMRVVHRTSPFYNRLWSQFGWDGMSGLPSTIALFRHRTTLQTLLTEDWIGLPTLTAQNRYCRDGSRFCTIGHTLALEYQWQAFRKEYSLPERVDCLSLQLNRGGFGDIDVARGPRDVTDAQPPRLVTHVTMTGAKQSDTEYLPSLCDLQNSSAFDILLADRALVERLCVMLESQERWPGRRFRVVLAEEPIPDALQLRLRLLGFCDYVVQRVENVGAVPALMQCKFGRLHGFPFLQRMEQVGADLLVTDMCSFSCPIFRVQVQLPVRAVLTSQCCCGRYDMYVWET